MGGGCIIHSGVETVNAREGWGDPEEDGQFPSDMGSLIRIGTQGMDRFLLSGSVLDQQECNQRGALSSSFFYVSSFFSFFSFCFSSFSFCFSSFPFLLLLLG